jgi:hypothetical protein
VVSQRVDHIAERVFIGHQLVNAIRPEVAVGRRFRRGAVEFQDDLIAIVDEENRCWVVFARAVGV